ncbi:T9SS type A sorting domain-containing protein [Bacteroidota bacterium]
MKNWIWLIFLAMASGLVNANNYYVSKDGIDSNTGTIETPFLTLAKAATIVVPGDTCFIKEGVYREELRITRSGQSGSPIVFRAFENDSVVISATDKVVDWIVHDGSIYKLEAKLTLDRQNMVYFDGKPMNMARWPNDTDDNRYTIDATLCTGGSASTIIGSGIPDLGWTGGYVWYLGAHSGASWTRPVTGFDATTGTISFPAVDINKWPFNPHNPTLVRNGNRGRFFLFGVLDALDHPGEWFYDAVTDTLYFQAPGDADPNLAVTEIASRENTINLAGSYIHVDGINAFGGRVLITGDNCIVRNGNLRHCLEILDELDNTDAQIGNGSINIVASNTIIEGNIIEYGSCNGIACLSAWKGGTKNTIRNNIIRHFNTIGNHSGPIRANNPYTSIIGNTIYSCGRDGIYNSGANSEIAWNDIYGCMKINNDGGVFYTVGNSSSKNTEIHHNWVHDSKGPSYADGRAAGIYLDNDSKGYHVHHNVVWNVTWTAVQMNWDNWYNNIFNNSFWDVGGAMGNWLNGRELIDNRIYNNYSHKGDWIGNEFKNNIIDPVSPFEDFAGRDFTPKYESPLFDAGVFITGTTDIYIGSAPDVGAYEFGLSPWRPGVNRDEGGDTLISLRISILEPLDNSTIVSPAEINIELAASSDDGISFTSLYLDDDLVSLDSLPPYSWKSSEYPVLKYMEAGDHVLRAGAQDINGISFFDQVKILVVQINPGDTVLLGQWAFEDAMPDTRTSNMVVNESRSFTNITDTVMFLEISEFDFNAVREADPLTPFVVRVDGDNEFTTLAIGSTRDTSEYDIGQNSFAFRDGVDTVLLLDPGETIAPGFMDAYPDGSGGGKGSVITFNENEPADEIWWTGGAVYYYSGKLIPGEAPIVITPPNTFYKRNYHFNLSFIIRKGLISGLNKREGGLSNGLSVYPNPVGDTPFYIETEHGSESRIYIYDIYGRQIHQTIMNEGRIILDPAVLKSAGLYIIREETNGKIRTAKISKY